MNKRELIQLKKVILFSFPIFGCTITLFNYLMMSIIHFQSTEINLNFIFYSVAAGSFLYSTIDVIIQEIIYDS